MSGHQALRSADVAIGDLADDLNGFVCRQIDLHDGAGFSDVYVWRRMIERVDPHLEAHLADDCRHDT
jgi:hypothetical protein